MRLCQEMMPRECCDLLFPSLTCPGDLPQYTDFPLRVHVSPPDTKLPLCQAINPPRKAAGKHLLHPRSLQIGTSGFLTQKGANGITLHAVLQIAGVIRRTIHTMMYCSVWGVSRCS